MIRALTAIAGMTVAGLVAVPTAASAAASDLDPSFNGTGQVTTPVGMGGDGGRAIVAAPGGGYIVVGTGSNDAGALRATVAKYTDAGALDTTFGAAHSGIATFDASSFGNALIQPHGVAVQPSTHDIVVAGVLGASLDEPGDFGIFRLHPDGTLDTSFGSSGYVRTGVGAALSDSVNAIAVDPSNGNFYVGGSSDSSSGVSRLTVVAYSANGMLRQSIGTSGLVITGVSGVDAGITSLALDGNKLVAAGHAGQQAVVTRYTVSGVDGTGDSTFNGGSPKVFSFGGDHSEASALAITSDDAVIVSGTGSYGSGSPQSCLAVARFTSAGALATSFGTSGIGHLCGSSGTQGSATSLVQTVSGQLYLAGGVYYGTTVHFALARFTASGAPDAAFAGGALALSDPAGPGMTSVAYGMVLDAGRPVLAGFAQPNSLDFVVERYVGDPTPVPPANTARPTITSTGSHVAGQTLTGDAGTWTNTPTGYHFVWVTCSNLPTLDNPCPNQQSGDGSQANDAVTAPTTTDTYTLKAADIGRYLVLEVKGENTAGYTTALSEPIALTDASPVNATPPTVSGPIAAGQTLTGTSGTWHNLPLDYDYAWITCTNQPQLPDNVCPDQQNGDGAQQVDYPVTANTDTYVIKQADMGKYLVLEVRGENQHGYNPAFSSVISLTASAPQNTSPPVISGKAGLGEVLTVTPGTWTAGPTSYDFRWFRCVHSTCSNEYPTEVRTKTLPATVSHDSYTLTRADLGQYMGVQVVASNSNGMTPASSQLFSTFVPQPPHNTSAPTFNGRTVVDDTITVQPGAWSGNPTQYTYYFADCDDPPEPGATTCPGAVWVQKDVRPASSSSDVYKFYDRDYGGTMLVLVTASNANGEGAPVGLPTTVVDNQAGTIAQLAATLDRLSEGIDDVSANVGKKLPGLAASGDTSWKLPVIDTKKPVSVAQVAVGMVNSNSNGIISNGSGSLISGKGLGIINSNNASLGQGLANIGGFGNPASIINANNAGVLSPGNGSIAMSAADVLGGKHHKVVKAKPLFSGAHVFHHPGKAAIRVKLTKTGRKLVKAYKKTAKRHHGKVPAIKILIITYIAPPSGTHNVVIADPHIVKVRF